MVPECKINDDDSYGGTGAGSGLSSVPGLRYLGSRERVRRRYFRCWAGDCVWSGGEGIHSDTHFNDEKEFSCF